MKKCISIFLISSSLCAAELFISGEVLYWGAAESDLSYALKVRGTNQINGITASPVMLAPKKVEQMSMGWDPGFRVGLGYAPECDAFDLCAYWTYFHDEKKNEANVPSFATAGSEFFPDVGQLALIDPWINIGNFTSTIDSPFLFDAISASWKLNLNVIDCEVGRNTVLSECFSFRPYAGVRAGFLNLDFKNNASLTPSPAESVRFKDHFENHFWGIGPLVGIQPKWAFTPWFSLISNIDAALLWGKSHAKKKEDYFATAEFGAFRLIDYKNHLHNNFSHFQAIVDLSLGFSFTKSWLCDRLCTTIDLVWEEHFWFNAATRLQLNTAFLNDLGAGSLQFGFQGYQEVESDLMFGGPVLKVCFAF